MPARTKLTEENIKELVRRFQDGANNQEAIKGIMSEDTFYRQIKENTEFAARMDVAKEYTTEVARAVVSKAIKRGDRETAKWWLERRAKSKFSLRTELTGADGTPVIPILGGQSAKQIEAEVIEQKDKDSDEDNLDK